MPCYIKNSRAIIFLILATTLSSCGTISYYGQSVFGHLQLIRVKQDLKTVLQSTDSTAELKQRLRNVIEIRNFASEVLQLPNNNSYRSYADIGRKYIVWNVFATPALSLQAHQSCFLLVGCLSYRGYFKKANAVAYMENLENKGFDVYLGGVAAYSTLGWFDDPILSSMLERNDIELARLIFHELAHQQLYIKDDTEFNEAFADAVSSIGLEYWLETHSTNELKKDFAFQLAREEQFTKLILSYQDKLSLLFQQDISDANKHAQKFSIYDELQVDYASLRASWGDYADYDEWFKHKLNNAKVAAISTYRNLVPSFLRAYEASGKDMNVFFSRVEKIGECESSRRRQLLRSTSPIDVC
ncbi:MAG: putative aminopeptidase [Gammaproteobacteria bacterium]|jgi:predicted aminopeptidase